MFKTQAHRTRLVGEVSGDRAIGSPTSARFGGRQLYVERMAKASDRGLSFSEEYVLRKGRLVLIGRTVGGLRARPIRFRRGSKSIRLSGTTRGAPVGDLLQFSARKGQTVRLALFDRGQSLTAHVFEDGAFSSSATAYASEIAGRPGPSNAMKDATTWKLLKSGNHEIVITNGEPAKPTPFTLVLEIR